MLTVGQARTGIDAVLGTPPPPLPAIVNTQLPIVGGAPIAPQVGYPLTVSRGYWTPGGMPVLMQWLVDGQPIPGASGEKYVPTLADLGKALAVRASASLPGYLPLTVTTLPTNPVSKQVQNSLRPRLKGTATVGGRLRVKPGRWRPPRCGHVPVPLVRRRRPHPRRPGRPAATDQGAQGVQNRLPGDRVRAGLDPLTVRTRGSVKVKQ